MGTDEQARALFDRYGLADVERVSDPGQDLYRAFGLRRGRFGQLFHPKVLWRGLVAALFRGHGVGRPVGDALQMPGAFLVRDGEVLRAFRHSTAADAPDYEDLASCPVS